MTDLRLNRVITLCVPIKFRRAWLALALLSVLAGWMPVAAQTPTLTQLYAFSAPAGVFPYAALIQAKDGNFYGTTASQLYGKYGVYDAGPGAVFRLTLGGVITALHHFTGPDGSHPLAGLLQASDGALYGTTSAGGVYGYGTVFKITLSGALTTLDSFNISDGANPQAGLIQANDGNLYGTTPSGGTSYEGSVFKITTSGTLTTLHSFDYPNGAYPVAALIQASDGNLYGTTDGGGLNGSGTVFRITPSGTLATLYSFTGGVDGRSPVACLVQANDGDLYATTSAGGANGSGTVFRITTSGTLTTLYTFTGGADGTFPYAALIQASDGNLYGTTAGDLGNTSYGTAFRITPSGTLTTLYSFNGSDGSQPEAALIQASDGNLYGMTSAGGPDNGGTVFRVSGLTTPVLTSLNPTATNAAGPAFTLMVKGSSFQSFSTVNWNGAPLTTTYLSATLLKAAVPASLIVAPGKAKVTVVNGSGGGTSNARSFTILLTTLKFEAANITRDSSNNTLTAVVALSNTGFLPANNTTVTKATINATSATNLPQSAGSIAVGSTATATLVFSGSAGSSGAKVTLKVSGTFTGGTFSGTLKVTLP